MCGAVVVLVAGQGAWVVKTGRCGCARWVELLGAGLAAVVVNAVVLIWELVRIDIFDHTGEISSE